MEKQRFYVTTTIPYVNARPHLGFALELVQADVLARHRRQAATRCASSAARTTTRSRTCWPRRRRASRCGSLVDRNAEAFAALREPLALSFDDFIRTSSDPRHRVGVERLWRRCAAAGICTAGITRGCTAWAASSSSPRTSWPAGAAPSTARNRVLVAEENWFFRLSRYADPLRAAITSGRLRIEPAARRNEVLAFIDGGLRGLLGVALPEPGARLGHPGAG